MSTTDVSAHDPATKGHDPSKQTGQEPSQCSTVVPHVGIVFAHGIGSQQSGDTLREWSAPFIGLLKEARFAAKQDGDPVVGTRLQSPDGTGLYVEVELTGTSPVVDGVANPRPEQHWIFTEAWWASRVAPPTFREMASWLGDDGTMARIAEAFVKGPRPAQTPVRGRPSKGAGAGADEEAETVTWPVIRQKISTQVVPIPRVVLSAMAALILVIYGVVRVVLRLIPVGALSDAVIKIDNFILNWFGDLQVLLGDYAQSSSVRARLAESLVMLKQMGCQKIIIVAHSGGAIVSYLTLCDEQYKDLQVDHLVTLGEGLNLAWEVTGADTAKVGDAVARHQFGRLLDTPMRQRKNLEWTDFWASKDPAPLGSLRIPEALRKPHPRAKDVQVWNRGSVGDDHGSYWTNDEEFVIPLAQLIERVAAPSGPGLLYPAEFVQPGAPTRPDLPLTPRRRARRERVWVRGLWSHAMLAFPIFTIAAAAMPLYLSGASLFLVSVGHAIINTIARIPGADLIGGLVGTLRSMHLPFYVHWWAVLGVAEVALVITLMLILVLGRVRNDPIVGRPGRVLVWIDRALSAIGAIWIVAYLVVLSPYFVAGLLFPPEDHVLGTLLVDGLALLAVLAAEGLGCVLSSWSPLPFLSAFAAVSLGSVAVLAPVVAVLMFGNFASMMVALGAIWIAFEVVRRIGLWRWAAWDERERRAARAAQFVPPPRRAVVAQGFLLAGAALCLLGSIAIAALLDHPRLVGPGFDTETAPVILGISIVICLLVVFVGVSLDSADANQVESLPAGNLRKLASSVERHSVSEN